MPKATLPSFVKKVLPFVNYSHPDVIEQIYMGILKAIVSDLRESGIIILPEFGTFKVTVHKERMSNNLGRGVIEKLPAYKTVKFTPGLKLKHYFYNLKEPMIE